MPPAPPTARERPPGTPLRRLHERDHRWYALLCVWLAAMVAGSGVMWRHKLTPAEVAAETPALWPAASTLSRASDRATLVMLAHPKCPCTRASIAELGRLMTEVHGEVDAHVLVVRPPGAPEGWEHAELWDRAAAIPGVTVHADIDGEESRRFGATTSGHVVIYDRAGRLRFRGGITMARGHEGDNAGRDQARAAIFQSLTDGVNPTFGCDLLSTDEIARRGDDGATIRR